MRPRDAALVRPTEREDPRAREDVVLDLGRTREAAAAMLREFRGDCLSALKGYRRSVEGWRSYGSVVEEAHALFGNAMVGEPNSNSTPPNLVRRPVSPELVDQR
jgi:hypothetical protein